MKQKGFSLIELMIALAIIGVVSAIAIPVYQDYMESARVSVMQDAIRTIELAQRERRRERGEFVAGSYIPGGSQTLTANLGWSSNASQDVISYVVTCETDSGSNDECTRTSGFTVTASHPEVANDVVMVFNP